MQIQNSVYYINCFLAACILASNGIRYILNIPESNVLIYMIYMLYLILSIILYKNKSMNNIFGLAIIAIILSCYIVITGMKGDIQDSVSGLKLICIFLISLCFYWMDGKAYRLTIDIVYFIAFVYVICLYIYPDRVLYFYNSGSNYLLLALPIGFVLSMRLTRIIFKIYTNRLSKELFLDIAMAVFYFLALIQFPARGSIIFPFLVMILFTLIIGRDYLFKSWIVLAGLVMLVFFGYAYFLDNASHMSVVRMQRLLVNVEGESRWRLWRRYIFMIVNEWQLLGGGTGCSMRELGFYPHNLYLQFVGEFGLIGFIFSMYLTFLVFFRHVKALLKMHLYSQVNLLFIEISAGLLYLFLCFMKSFSIYDGVSIMMMTMAAISLSQQDSNKTTV